VALSVLRSRLTEDEGCTILVNFVTVTIDLGLGGVVFENDNIGWGGSVSAVRPSCGGRGGRTFRHYGCGWGCGCERSVGSGADYQSQFMNPGQEGHVM